MQQAPFQMVGEERIDAGAHVGAPHADAVMQQDHALLDHITAQKRHVGTHHVGVVQAVDEGEIERAKPLADLRSHHRQVQAWRDAA